MKEDKPPSGVKVGARQPLLAAEQAGLWATPSYRVVAKITKM